MRRLSLPNKSIQFSPLRLLSLLEIWKLVCCLRPRFTNNITSRFFCRFRLLIVFHLQSPAIHQLYSALSSHFRFTLETTLMATMSLESEQERGYMSLAAETNSGALASRSVSAFLVIHVYLFAKSANFENIFSSLLLTRIWHLPLLKCATCHFVSIYLTQIVRANSDSSRRRLSTGSIIRQCDWYSHRIMDISN